MSFKISIAQLNLKVGDLKGNSEQIIAHAQQAYANGASWVLTPELSISSYSPEDLVLRPSFLQHCQEQLHAIANALANLKGLSVLVGYPVKDNASGACFNAMSRVFEGQVLDTYYKQELPNYAVFDEQRYFASGKQLGLFDLPIRSAPNKTVKVGLLICEDAWKPRLASLLKNAGAEILLVANASPFHKGKAQEREAVMAQRCQESNLPLVYAHMVGGQDEFIFDGASFALNAQGQVVARAQSFAPDDFYLAVQSAVEGSALTIQSNPANIQPHMERLESIWHALVMGVRDYIGKNRFPGALLGLSGGVDSALVLAVAVDAIGADKVRAVMMPSPYTADISVVDAREMAKRVGIVYDEISILPQFEAFKQSLNPIFEGRPEDTTEENIQARIRGVFLMAMSNKLGQIVLTTGNKSELSTGYCTLYGDMAGGFAVIKDLLKTTVYELCYWRNQNNPYKTVNDPIPLRILTRPPSAELRPDQTDQDSLPEYDVLDAIVELYMEQNVSINDIVAQGFIRADVEKVARLIKINEYKRKQAPVGIRISQRSFGKDWRYPITNSYLA